LSRLNFLSNSLSDSYFESHLKDTHRYLDYCDVRDHLLPDLITSIEPSSQLINFQFSCSNRFEGQYPTLRIQCPVGFVPDVIGIEFPPRHEFFHVRQAAQEFKVQGLDKLANHLRVILMMGLAHWQPK
jgi:hypothetical protein